MLKLEGKLSPGSAITFFFLQFSKEKVKKKRVKLNLFFAVVNYAPLWKSLETNYSNKSLLSPVLKDKSCPCSERTGPRKGGKLCKPCLSPAPPRTREELGPPAAQSVRSYPAPPHMSQCQSRKVGSSFQPPSPLTPLSSQSINTR